MPLFFHSSVVVTRSLTLKTCALVLALLCNLHASEGTLHIMPLGDSITQAAPGYRAPLFKLLKEAGHQVDFVGTMSDQVKGEARYDLDHEGHGGFTVGPGPSAADQWTGGKGNVFDNLDHWLAAKNPKTKQVDIILLHIGVNDYANIKERDPGYVVERDFAGRYAGLLDKILSLRPQTAIICSTVIPGGNLDLPAVFSVGPFGKVNAQLAAVVAARSSHVFLYDGAKLQGTGLSWEPTDWNKGDVIHPNDQGHAKFAKFWAAAIEDVLKKKLLPKTAYVATGK